MGPAVLNAMLSARLNTALRRLEEDSTECGGQSDIGRILRFETRLKRPTTIGEACMQLARLSRLKEVPELQLHALAWGDHTLNLKTTETHGSVVA
jgi:hypothetical protein